MFVTLFPVSSAGFYAYSCPSSPVTYASEGDNVTMCWRILLKAKAMLKLKGFSVIALKRPFEAAMETVASVNHDGTFFRFYENFTMTA